MSIKDQLYEKKQGRSCQVLRRESNIKLTTPQVEAVFKDEEPDPRHLKIVCEALEIDFEPAPNKVKPVKMETKPLAESRKAQIPILRASIEKIQGRDKSTLKKAKGQACVKCGKNDGTVVSCHYNGPIQHKLGQGMGCKVNDYYTAFLCHSCHAEVDQKKFTKGVASELAKVWASHEMLEYIIETLIMKLKGEE